jgi:hypothetical protein
MGVATVLSTISGTLVVNQFGYRLQTVALRESHRNSLAGQKVCEERVGSAIELWGGNDITSQLGYVLHGVMHGCLTAANALPFKTALQGGDAPFQHCRRRVADTGITEAFRLKVE